MDQERQPRTPRGRQTANYQKRLDEAQELLEATDPADRFADDHTTEVMAEVDAAYVSGAPLRRTDREVVRLRRLVSREGPAAELADDNAEVAASDPEGAR
jgi:hypothetical protein